MELNVALLGFGNVGRALAQLLMAKADTLRQDFNLHVRVVGISTGQHGHVVDHRGVDLRAALDAVRQGSSLERLQGDRPIRDTTQFLSEVPAQLVFESTPTNPHDGQPALAYDFGLLERGIHVVTANKGPVAFGFRELSALAARNDVGFFFESSVMDGAPVHGIGREGLPAARIERITGILNSTTNYILTRMESEGLSFEEALKGAQEIGVAETDPTLDVDGWDASIKIVILANVWMGADLRPVDVDRTGIRGITLEEVQRAVREGQRTRLICEALRATGGKVTARVSPQRVPATDVLASITGTNSIMSFHTDVLPNLTIIEHDSGPTTTAYGMLADMINIMRGRYHGLPRLHG